MFTGIIEDIGFITNIYNSSNLENINNGIRLFVKVNNIDLKSISIGDSISIQGACMTVTNIEGSGFYVDISQESLKCTVGLSSVGEVNIERALKLESRMGGHILYGHVDCIGKVYDFSPCGESKALAIDIPTNFAKFVAYKGSIAINGVSLTTNSVVDYNEFSRMTINIIPHTQVTTTLHKLSKNDSVNVEIDSIARYVDRILTFNK
ncbi:riboflavin synthase [Candidatus Kinetoplastidibacterium crithidiae]|uniref:Riboflavin synthase n=1 Tax=Candidatus Kinetoplastidibacterium crithidiae TCC036E TaxID=1208918 RepID=M1M718_9PROT|nr:riboflavin synthase [Candidatus Kinetoplastibacterium crithidii]AFZ82879.1 riboflavin synthase subunit alpha [Candidatus Kinetoplastibacterium crithidii (ex Angomonas deanei ATCC 30255)]AGF47880.1 riboflavin synthase alpha chain [Candidatus Kinetoplastibacterium crithidii TCC036E]